MGFGTMLLGRDTVIRKLLFTFDVEKKYNSVIGDVSLIVNVTPNTFKHYNSKLMLGMRRKIIYSTTRGIANSVRASEQQLRK